VYNGLKEIASREEEAMSEKQILNMLEQGSISADEAAGLLEAISANETAEEAVPGSALADSPQSAQLGKVPRGTLSPNARRWKHLQLIPLGLSLLLLIATAWGLWAVYRAADARVTFWGVVFLLLFLLAIAATTISVWITTAPWLHIRVRERSGKTIAISLPVPLTLASLAIRIARRFVDEQTAQYLDASSDFVRAMRRERRHADPIEISVDEGDQHVQVYFG
jgi:hypothetical protein